MHPDEGCSMASIPAATPTHAPAVEVVAYCGRFAKSHELRFELHSCSFTHAWLRCVEQSTTLQGVSRLICPALKRCSLCSQAVNFGSNTRWGASQFRTNCLSPLVNA